jgi:hypothetical protein
VKKINGSKFNLGFADQETLKVKIVKRIKIAPFANYAFNGADPVLPVATSYTRKLTRAGVNADPSASFLSVRVTFAEQGGGSFSLLVSGDQGGDVSIFDYDQAGAQSEEQVNYTINILEQIDGRSATDEKSPNDIVAVLSSPKRRKRRGC